MSVKKYAFKQAGVGAGHSQKDKQSDLVRLLDALIAHYKKRQNTVSLKDEKAQHEQELNTLERQRRQLDPAYIRKRAILLTGCPFAKLDHFHSAQKAPVRNIGKLEVVAKQAHWKGLDEGFGNERPKREVTQWVKAEQRGDYWIAVIDEAVLATPWSHFTYELLAFQHDYNFEPRPRDSATPALPALSMPTSVLYAQGSIPQYHYFQACRITHRSSSIEMRIHSCAKHTNLIEIIGLNLSGSSNTDLQLLNQALKFFWYKRRVVTRTVNYPEYGGDHQYEVAYEAGDGRPTGAKGKEKKQFSKTSLSVELETAVRKLGDDATQDKVARLMGIGTGKTLYRERVRLKVALNWKGYVREILDQ